MSNAPPPVIPSNAPPAPAPTPPAVVTLGEAMALLVTTSVGPMRRASGFTLDIGGAESNVAIALERLGVHAAWIGVVGDDEFGALILERLRAEGVDLAAARVSRAAPTGIMFRERRTGGSLRVLYHRAGSAASAMSPGDVDGSLIARARVLHVSGITPALGAGPAAALDAAIDVAKRHGVAVSLDLNYRSRLWSVERARSALRRLAARADIVFATADEAALVVDGAWPAPATDPEPLARALGALGPAEVAVKLGARGALTCFDGEIVRMAGRRVPLVDPVGAGDAFAAGYLAGWLEGLSPHERTRLACDVGAFAVTVEGDCSGLPTRAELALLDGLEGEVAR